MLDTDAFIRDGFVRLDQAVPRDLVEACAAILWREAGVDPNDAATWTKPVIRLGFHAEVPFREAANTPPLHAAYDALVGAGRWQAPGGLGTFPLRFPVPEDPGDAGWHIDVSFGGTPDDFLSWRANVISQGRALLLLFLLTDIGEDDAPTRIRVGSHRDIARRLAPAREAGLSLRDLLESGAFDECPDDRVAFATGAVGTVYLCHPFLVHAAQPHRGTRPRIIAQPPLLPAMPLSIDRADAAYSPVEQAIRAAL